MSQRATTGGVCSRLFKSPGPRSPGEARGAGCVEDGASDAASSEIETGGGVAAAAAAGAYAFWLSEALDKVEREAEAPLESVRRVDWGGAVVVVESALRRTEALPQEATTIWRRESADEDGASLATGPPDREYDESDGEDGLDSDEPSGPSKGPFSSVSPHTCLYLPTYSYLPLPTYLSRGR